MSWCQRFWHPYICNYYRVRIGDDEFISHSKTLNPFVQTLLSWI